MLTMLGTTLVRAARSAARPNGAALVARRSTSGLSGHDLIPQMPSKASVLVFAGITVVLPTVVYAGASAAKNIVQYVEDNDIWRPEEDDD
ncbi:hypothetical protein PTSG_01435 [Salpingoeca rosetta]|uniref:Uncharacterized protein n=1 Tax=Salpingoeca rosetta (strain ATCC 50818 / BSB-021) TaxID=946362 RepID=F2U0C1_SALR5|nr:uncharacterized protein PTSG_01435 [Salpingoeca rosetta]EGD80849.1 hypothetical protein PTSG_01435 [Salpingoeca rosetta]|eukprot:XP_004997410.1 hypothetical protein PTSG_01435 [Salpingoeca rosetta]